jgi:glycosyltransferase involved in cell wall biosynthesis
MVEYLLDRPEEKFLYYHNITPSQFFEPYDAAAAVQMDMGRAEMARLCKTVRVAMANSEYSARELRGWGVEEVMVVPPYLMSHTPRPSRGRLSWLTRTKRGIDVLFVGRIVPNKGHMHLLRSFAALRAASDQEARLFVAGAWGPQLYMLAIQQVRERLGDTGVTLTGSITESSLAAHYRAADVFVCLSEHEGFCIPLVEAMRNGVPVVAYDAGAVGETLGGAGVLLRTLDPLLIAETVYRVATDEVLRAELIEGQKKRADELEAFPRDEAIVTNARRALRL